MATRNQAQNNQVGYYDSAAVTPRSKQVRRINNDFEYLNEANLSAHATNDEQFNASYQTKGLRSTARSEERQRKLQEEEAANDENYEAQLQAQELEDEEGHHQNRLVAAAGAKAKQKLLGRIVGKTRASAINASVMAWGGTLWLFVQLPFAIISMAMIGVSAAVGEAMRATGFVGSVVAWLTARVLEGVNLVFGVELTAIAENLFLATYVVVLAIGIVTILGAYLQYTLSLLLPLGGRGSSLKMGMLLLALLGYAIPVVNIFPWVLLWMAAVWKYPR